MLVHGFERETTIRGWMLATVSVGPDTEAERIPPVTRVTRSEEKCRKQRNAAGRDSVPRPELGFYRARTTRTMSATTTIVPNKP